METPAKPKRLPITQKFYAFYHAPIVKFWFNTVSFLLCNIWWFFGGCFFGGVRGLDNQYLIFWYLGSFCNSSVTCISLCFVFLFNKQNLILVNWK